MRLFLKLKMPSIVGSAVENDAMGADTERANFRHGPNIPSEAAESLLDTSMSERRSNHTSERRFAAENATTPCGWF